MASLGYPFKFQWVSRLGSVTARPSSSGHQSNFAALNRGRYLYLAGRPSRWALAHLLVLLTFIAELAGGICCSMIVILVASLAFYTTGYYDALAWMSLSLAFFLVCLSLTGSFILLFHMTTVITAKRFSELIPCAHVTDTIVF